MRVSKLVLCLLAGATFFLVEVSDTYAGSRAMRASWYGKQFHGRLMANGKRFDMFDPKTVAHKSLPFGTKLKLTNPKNGRVIWVVVRDRGPYVKGRHIDLSYAAAKALGILQSGVATLRVE